MKIFYEKYVKRKTSLPMPNKTNNLIIVSHFNY